LIPTINITWAFNKIYKDSCCHRSGGAMLESLNMEMGDHVKWESRVLML